MSTLSIYQIYRPELIMLKREQMERVDHYLGYDSGRREGRRNIRPSARPEFTVVVQTEEDYGNIECPATIVVVNMPATSTNQIEPGTPLAIASVEVNGTEYYLLIFTSRAHSSDLDVSDVLIDYDGEPEELLAQPDLFDPED